MDLQQIGNRIRDIRKLKKISQADIAAELDISITAFSKIERGLTNLSINRLDEISKLLNVSIITLLLDTKNKDYPTPQDFQIESNSVLEKELNYTKELLKAKEEIIELLKNKLKV